MMKPGGVSGNLGGLLRGLLNSETVGSIGDDEHESGGDSFTECMLLFCVTVRSLVTCWVFHGMMVGSQFEGWQDGQVNW